MLRPAFAFTFRPGLATVPRAGAGHIGYPKVFGDQEVAVLGDGVCNQGAAGTVAELVAPGVSLLVQLLELAQGLGIG